jgi:hypothetical protein
MTEQEVVFEEILILSPPPLRIQHLRIPTDLVDFDAANPRLRYQKELYPDKSDIDLLFDSEPDTAWLKKDIKDKGIIDPIYVRKVGARYKCVEGNRRTGCQKKLHEEEPNNPRFMTMPARILPESTTEDQTALLMASFHVSGKVKWEPHEKAGHIYHMLNVLRIPEAELANTLHMAVPTIKRTALSFAILEETYKRIDGGKYADKAAGRWSFFSEMLKIKPLRLERERDPAGWDAKFCRWVGEGRIPNAVDIRDLPDILKKAKARHLFENEDVAQAFDLARKAADETRPANISRVFKQLEKTLEAVNAAQLNDINLAGENDAARVLLTDTYQAIGSFMERAGVRAPGPRRAA